MSPLWEPIILAYHHRELVVLANPWDWLRANSLGISQQLAGGSRKPVDEGDLKYIALKEFSNIEPPSES
jgi:hypothetical protein